MDIRSHVKIHIERLLLFRIGDCGETRQHAFKQNILVRIGPREHEKNRMYRKMVSRLTDVLPFVRSFTTRVFEKIWRLTPSNFTSSIVSMLMSGAFMLTVIF